jgi:hypothetical protein
MKPTEFQPLSAETERLLASERKFFPEDAELRARALARARAALRDGGPLAVRESIWWRARLLMAAAVVVAFAAVSWAAWHDRNLPAERVPGATQPASGETGDRAPRVEPPKGREAAPPEETSAGEPGVLEKADQVPAPRPSSVQDAYALELSVLQRARAAVARADFSTALGAIAEHQRRFPTGRLGEEREALRVKALVGLGKTEEARRAAARFRERFPRSVLSPRIDEAARPAP